MKILSNIDWEYEMAELLGGDWLAAQARLTASHEALRARVGACYIDRAAARGQSARLLELVRKLRPMLDDDCAWAAEIDAELEAADKAQ